MVMIDFNTDVSSFWEYSALGFRPTEESTEAYELGVNYLYYALTNELPGYGLSRFLFIGLVDCFRSDPADPRHPKHPNTLRRRCRT